jgi:hypothetical protein
MEVRLLRSGPREALFGLGTFALRLEAFSIGFAESLVAETVFQHNSNMALVRHANNQAAPPFACCAFT